jgi:hypothetical protein
MYGVFGSSKLPVRKFVLQLDVSEEKRKFLRLQHKTFLSFSVYCSSFFKQLGSVEVVASMCPGNVHTALRHNSNHNLWQHIRTFSNGILRFISPLSGALPSLFLSFILMWCLPYSILIYIFGCPVFSLQCKLMARVLHAENILFSSAI